MATAPANKSRLGRGLASLIGEGDNRSKGKGGAQAQNTTAAVAAVVEPVGKGHGNIAIDLIAPSLLNPRQDFRPDELEELARSIKERGLVQPLVVRPAPDREGYEVVAGERRWRAAQMAALHNVPVIIRDLTDQEVLELAIIENVQRTDLNPIEEATGYSQLVDRFGYRQEDLAKVIGKSRSHLANTMRLLKLPPTVQGLVRDGRLSAGHARALIGHEDAEVLAMTIVEKGLSVRDIEALMQAEKKTGDNSQTVLAAASAAKDADTRAVEKQLSDSLGLKITIKSGVGEAGELRIKYKSLDQFEEVRARLVRGR